MSQQSVNQNTRWSTGIISKSSWFYDLMVFVWNDPKASPRILMEITPQQILIRETWRTFWAVIGTNLTKSRKSIVSTGSSKHRRNHELPLMPVKFVVKLLLGLRRKNCPGGFLKRRTAKVSIVSYLLIPSMQRPPWRHGWGTHSSTFASQCIPVKPGAQVQV